MGMMLQEAARWFGVKKSGEPPSGLEGWIPAVHILESGKGIAIRAELPGINQNEVNVSVEGQVISIAGERKPKRSGHPRRGKRPDLDYGAFVLCFKLPASLDGERVRSKFDKGMLEISLRAKQQRSAGPDRDTNSRTPAATRNHPPPRALPSV